MDIDWQVKLNIILTLVTIVSVVVNIVLVLRERSEKNRVRGVVGSWQNHIEGIKNSLLSIAYPIHGQAPTHDYVRGIVQSAGQQAASLEKAMIELRFYNDEEVKKQKEQKDRETKELLESFKRRSS